MVHVLRSLAIGVLLCAFQSSAQTLLYYWHFNNFTGVSGAVDPSTLTPIPADYALQDSSNVKMAYKTLPGVGPNYKTFWDASTGCDTNDRLGNPAGNCLRLRNPSDSMQLVMNIPSTGYQAITVKYTVQRSSAGNGATVNSFSYSLDSGLTWKTSGLSIPSALTDPAWSSPITVTLNDSMAANNHKLAFRILFTGSQNTGASGNNRIDNVSVEGTLIPVSPYAQLIYTSDAHYGITRRFQRTANVSAQIVNQVMVRKMNALPSLTIPSDNGLRSGQTVGAIDYIMESGDIANRQEKAKNYPADSIDWLQFWGDYNDSLKLTNNQSQKTPMFLLPGNHDVSNAIGYYTLMNPLTDPTSMVQIYNLMLNPTVPKTNPTYNYATDKINYSRTIKGVHVMFVNMWPDSANRMWMESDLASVPSTTPVFIVTHDQPQVESKHFSNPNAPYTINGTDKFENLLAEHLKDGAKTINDVATVEMRGFAVFLKNHPNIKAYFHGNDNANEFYVWRGPDNDVALNVYRVDSPMKGNFSGSDETKLSFQFIVIDSVQQKMTVRECLWNPDSTNVNAPMAWGQTTTLSLSTGVNAATTIRINGRHADTTISGTTPVNMTISLKANDWANKNAEYWVYCSSPVNSPLNGQRYYYGLLNGQWGWSLNTVSTTLPLADMNNQVVYNQPYLPSGSYTAYFAIDTIINGALDQAAAIDSVKFTIDNNCTPMIKINGSATDVVLPGSAPLQVSVGLQSKGWVGIACDYFVYCDAPWGNRYFFNMNSNQWQSGASYQGNAVDVEDYPVFNMSGLPSGTYTFYFTMDNKQNGIMDGSQVTASIRATVQ